MAIKYTEAGMIEDFVQVLQLHGRSKLAAELTVGDFQRASDWARIWLGNPFYDFPEDTGICSDPGGCPPKLATFADAWISIALTMILGDDDDGSDEDKGNEYDAYCYELRRAVHLAKGKEKPPYWELPWKTRMATREFEAASEG